MDEKRIERLEAVMERGFGTLADLQRETNARLEQTNARLDQTNARLSTLEGKVDVLTGRVNAIEHVLTDLAAELVMHGRVLRAFVEKHDAALEDLRRRMDAVERRLGPEQH